jgi:hypothetical protein
VRLRNVQASKPVVGFRISRAPSGDRSPDAGFDQVESPQDMDQ